MQIYQKNTNQHTKQIQNKYKKHTTIIHVANYLKHLDSLVCRVGAPQEGLILWNILLYVLCVYFHCIYFVLFLYLLCIYFVFVGPQPCTPDCLNLLNNLLYVLLLYVSCIHFVFVSYFGLYFCGIFALA